MIGAERAGGGAVLIDAPEASPASERCEGVVRGCATTTSREDAFLWVLLKGTLTHDSPCGLIAFAAKPSTVA